MHNLPAMLHRDVRRIHQIDHVTGLKIAVQTNDSRRQQ